MNEILRHTVGSPRTNRDNVSRCIQVNRPNRWDPETMGVESLGTWRRTEWNSDSICLPDSMIGFSDSGAMVTTYPGAILTEIETLRTEVHGKGPG
jgi:hypothetical protein